MSTIRKKRAISLAHVITRLLKCLSEHFLQLIVYWKTCSHHLRCTKVLTKSKEGSMCLITIASLILVRCAALMRLWFAVMSLFLMCSRFCFDVLLLFLFLNHVKAACCFSLCHLDLLVFGLLVDCRLLHLMWRVCLDSMPCAQWLWV